MKPTFDALHSYKDWALLIMRVVLGAIFIYHGTQKWGMEPGGLPQWQITFLSIVEPLGGLLILLGFYAELGALAIAVVMVGAWYTKMQVWGIGFVGTQGSGWEFDIALLAGALMIATHGAGKYAFGTCCSDKK